MAKVYVVQKQMKQDYQSGEFVEKFDLSPAKQYGELVYLLSPTCAAWKPEKPMKELQEGLKDFTENDYILLIGNPVLLGLASIFAADRVDSINFLQWSGRNQRYEVINAKIPLSYA